MNAVTSTETVNPAPESGGAEAPSLATPTSAAPMPPAEPPTQPPTGRPAFDPPAARALHPLATAVIGVADLMIDLIVLSIAGTIVWTLLTTGISLVVVLGIGLLVMLLGVWVLRGYDWFERRRTGAVYGIDIPGLPRRRTPHSGFKGFLHQCWLDASDSTPWRALGHLVASTVLAWVFFALAVVGLGAGTGTVVAIATGVAASDDGAGSWQSWLQTPVALPIGILAMVVGLAAALGYGFVDRALTRGILGASRTAVLQRQVAAVSAQRSGAVAAAEQQRVSIERDLHDGVQPRLVSVAMTLGMAKAKFDTEPEAARELIDTAHTETKDAITELRRLARGLHPAVLEDRGLDAALSAIVARSPVPVTLDVDLPERASSQAEAVVYFAVSEAITNIAKHARATRCSVRVDRVGDRIVATITDDGIGGALVGQVGAPAISSGGLAGIRDRAVAAGGSLRVSSPVGGPTVITVEVPCAS